MLTEFVSYPKFQFVRHHIFSCGNKSFKFTPSMSANEGALAVTFMYKQWRKKEAW